jgi:hypothetical protein
MRKARNAYKILIEEITWETRHRGDDKIKMYRRETGCEDFYWIELAWSRVHWWAYVNIVMNLQVSAMENILTSWIAINCSRFLYYVISASTNLASFQLIYE